MAFHEVLFPIAIGFGATGGPERRTDIVQLASGHEQRNARWADSRRRYNAGTGVRSLADLHALIAFFEERRGRFHGFRWRDRADRSSAVPPAAVTAADQVLGTGDGTTAAFPLVKSYGIGFSPYRRPIAKPVAGTVRVAVAGVERSEGIDFTLEPTTGIVMFLPDALPGAGEAVTAGFAFDVPVRFDTDRLDINLAAFEAGEIPNIPIVEIRP